MKHPLTSKERRGLLAVAATALLCISSAFIFRNCSSFSRLNQSKTEMALDSISLDNLADTLIYNDAINNANKAIESKKTKRYNKENKTSRKEKSSKKSNKNKTPKSYPIRDPLSEPCD